MNLGEDQQMQDLVTTSLVVMECLSRPSKHHVVSSVDIHSMYQPHWYVLSEVALTTNLKSKEDSPVLRAPYPVASWDLSYEFRPVHQLRLVFPIDQNVCQVICQEV